MHHVRGIVKQWLHVSLLGTLCIERILMGCLLLQSDLSCRNTKQTVGAIYTRTNFVTLKYVTDGWGTESNGFKLVITAFKDKSKYAHNLYLSCHVRFLWCHTSSQFAYFSNTVRTPLIRINWEGEKSGYAENPDNWTLLIIKSTRCTNYSNLFLEWNSTCL